MVQELRLGASDAARGCCQRMQRKILSRAQGGGGLKPACCTELAHLHFFEAGAPSTPLFVSFLDGAAALSSLSPLPSLFIAMSLLERSGPPRDR